LVFFFVLKSNIEDNVDENLERKKATVIHEFLENELKIDKYIFEYSDFFIKPLNSLEYKKNYSAFTDTLVYESTDNETQEYRKLETYFQHEGKYYQLTIIKPLFETNDIVRAIAIVLASLYFIIVLALVASSRLLTRKIWKPFYKMIDAVRKYSLDKHQPLQPVETTIEEFQQLNESLISLTENNYKTFVSQKQFIENASHEMQTPLSVILSKCEIVYQQPELPEAIAHEVDKIHDAANRLSKMNQSLLLLSKIENNQFSEKSEEDISINVNRILEFFEDMKEGKNIKLSLDLPENQTISANPVLLEIMLTNLIKNAFVHNVSQGMVDIHASSHKFEIKNSRPSQQLEEDRLFKRFGKQSDNKDGLGLGLSIVKKICEIHNWQISCQLEENRIVFTVIF